jgi:hypothetical protein
MLFRVAAVLMVLFDVGHTVGFRQSDPTWGVDALLASMQSKHFDLQSFSRTYWDLYTGLGTFVAVLMLFSAVVTWQLGGLPAESFARLRGIALTLALTWLALAIVSWQFLFSAPLVFCLAISACLFAALWRRDRAKGTLAGGSGGA